MEYYETQSLKLLDDGYNTDLLADPNGFYAFSDIYLVPRDLLETTTRQTYSILEALGDVGGLNDILHLIVEFFLKRYQGFYQASILLTGLFRYKPSHTYTESKYERYSDVRQTLNTTSHIKRMSFLFYRLCLKSKARKDYRRKLDLADK